MKQKAGSNERSPTGTRYTLAKWTLLVILNNSRSSIGASVACTTISPNNPYVN